MPGHRRARALLLALAMAVVLTSAAFTHPTRAAAERPRADAPGTSVPAGIESLGHLIFIVQENRSFDHYFGTYRSPSGDPVDGIPRNADDGFTVCIPNPVRRECQEPYHSTTLADIGGPHGHDASVTDVNGGKMNGFIRAAMAFDRARNCIEHPFRAACRAKTGPDGQPDVIGYHTDQEIPNYWAYADWGVLQDRMFAPVDSWSLPAHLYLVSAWAATCTSGPMSCRSEPQTPVAPVYPWTDITYLLHEQGVPWGYYVSDETDLSCALPLTRRDCARRENVSEVSWNPLLWFRTVKDAGQQDNVRHTSDFLRQVENGTLPPVSWVIPGELESEHPNHGSLRPGERYVTRLVNAIGQSPIWNDAAIFITWDDWGGFYDHVRPPRVDAMGYGIRVPGLVLGPYAKQAYVDHQLLSFDAYLKLIEDRFLGGERLDPSTLSRPDSRPSVRETKPGLGDLAAAFDFSQVPRPAPILPT